MLPRSNYEAICKYIDENKSPFDRDELSLVYSLLGIRHDLSEFDPRHMETYRSTIAAILERQNRFIHELMSNYAILKEESELKAYQYLVGRLGEIESPFVLDAVISDTLSTEEFHKFHLKRPE